MSELQALTAQRDALLEKIREIEASCEGIENENNARRVQELNLEQAQLSAQKQEFSAKISALEARLSAIGSEIATLSGTGIDRILEAIKKQRWYFFKNKTKILLDRNTGLLWANLNYYNTYKDEKGWYSVKDSSDSLRTLRLDDIGSWRFPYLSEFKLMFDSSFPFRDGDRIKDNFSHNASYYKLKDDTYATVQTDSSCKRHDDSTFGCAWFPCSSKLIDNSEYEKNVSPSNPNYTEKERLQFTLDLFTQNDLWPVFDDAEITELYKKIYYEKPRLLEQLQELQSEIENMQSIVLLSSTFDEKALLAKYDIKAIDASVIKYYQAVQQWTEELLEKLSCYECEKEDTIQNFNLAVQKLRHLYGKNFSSSPEENDLLKKRQRFFMDAFSLNMGTVRTKLLAVKHQADALEARIDAIDSSDDAVRQLALLEKEERAGFALIAENTSKILRNALKKIEFFEANPEYVAWAVGTQETWTEKYRIFETEYAEALRIISKEEIWKEWHEIRFRIEMMLQPVIARELRGRIPMIKEDEISVAQQLIAELGVYRNAVDTFFREEREGISKKNSGLQDKLETESRLYQLTADFQNAVQAIIFNCARPEDRLFILNWVSGIADIQIDEVLSQFDKNSDNPVPEKLAGLKKKHYELYLSDAKACTEEQASRNEKFQALLNELRQVQ